MRPRLRTRRKSEQGHVALPGTNILFFAVYLKTVESEKLKIESAIFPDAKFNEPALLVIVGFFAVFFWHGLLVVPPLQ